MRLIFNLLKTIIKQKVSRDNNLEQNILHQWKVSKNIAINYLKGKNALPIYCTSGNHLFSYQEFKTVFKVMKSKENSITEKKLFCKNRTLIKSMERTNDSFGLLSLYKSDK